MATVNNVMTSKFPRAGYRVHFDRLRDIRTATTAMRTHKFKCAIPSKEAENELKEKFEKVAQVVCSSEEGSGMWFLIQLIGIGFLLPYAENRSEAIFNILSDGSVDLGFPVPNQMALKKVLMTGYSNPKNIENGLCEVWKVEKKESLPNIAKEIISEIRSYLQNSPNSKIGSKKTGLNSWVKDIFAKKLDCPLISNIKKEGEGIEKLIIFNSKFIEWNKEKIQEWIVNQSIPEISLSDSSYPWLFQNIIPTMLLLAQNGASNLAKDPMELINPYHATGKFLLQFRENTDELKKILEKQISDSFNEKPELIDLLTKYIRTCSKKVPIANENDFISKEWAEYRDTHFSGRLSGWISNFLARLADYEVALSDSIHEKELKLWKVSDALKDFFLKPKNESITEFEFQRNPYSISADENIHQKLLDMFETKEVDKKTGEIKSYKLKNNFQTEKLIERYNNISKSHINILNEIQSNCDLEIIFPEDVKGAFFQLKSLQPILLEKLREVTLGIKGKIGDSRTLGEALDEYRQFLKTVREFLMVWENEGILKNPEWFNPSENQAMAVWKNKMEKPEKLWISEKLLKEKKKISENDGNEEKELDESIFIGYWSKEMIPNELKKYPSFIGQANGVSDKEKVYAKNNNFVAVSGEMDEQIRIFNAKSLLLDYALNGGVFCSSIEQQQVPGWENISWLSTKKENNGKSEIVWHFGTFHKAIESLRKIAKGAKNPIKIMGFIDLFVGIDEKFLENFIEVQNRKNKSVDILKEKLKLEQKMDEWKKFISDWQKWRHEKPVTKEAKKEKLKFDEEIDSKIAQFRFYLSGKEYGNHIAIPLTVPSYAEFIEKFESYFGFSKEMSRSNFEIFFELHSDGIGKDVATKGELLKYWWGLRMKPMSSALNLPDFGGDFSNFVKDWVSVRSLIFDPKTGVQKHEILSKLAHRFLQAGFGAEIRGKIGLLSRKDFIKRNVLQIGSGKQSILRYVPREWGDFSNFDQKHQIRLKEKSKNQSFSQQSIQILRDYEIDSTISNKEVVENIWKTCRKLSDIKEIQSLSNVLGEIPHSWEMVLITKQKIDSLNNSPQNTQNGFFIEKSEDKSIFNFTDSISRGSYGYSFPIQTSVVQKQFLERFLWGDKNGLLTEKITGPSVILERTMKVNWQNGNVNFSEQDFEMYMAIPFQFSKEGSRVEKGDFYRKSIKENGENILGIDLGEYGFGWAIFNPETEKFEVSGFQRIPLLKKMRDEAAGWKDTQIRGIFNRPTTYLAELREQAAGQIRNQIHRLALEHHAKPIYEDSVDAFETGGQRISKLYKTLMTADMSGGNQADEAVRKHIWGNAFASIGGVIGASKTSQTCRKCGWCATSEIDGMFKGKDELEIKDGKLGNIKVDLNDGMYKKYDVFRVVKKAQRFESKEEQKKRENGEKQRGTVEKFQCQICWNEADADEQAARNIALKYYFKNNQAFEKEREIKDGNGKEKAFYIQGQFSSLKFFLTKSKEDKWKNTI